MKHCCDRCTALIAPPRPTLPQPSLALMKKSKTKFKKEILRRCKLELSSRPQLTHAPVAHPRPPDAHPRSPSHTHASHSPTTPITAHPCHPPPTHAPHSSPMPPPPTHATHSSLTPSIAHPHTILSHALLYHSSSISVKPSTHQRFSRQPHHATLPTPHSPHHLRLCPTSAMHPRTPRHALRLTEACSPKP
ncbi:uncharacterized protein LOC135101806 [Scylla paramamosain]|uniref:uncharacterized protein LOC135101806 n=1 Tax=Scylla paramamosain TaxID=85552 RepID=UPI00308345D4